MIEPCTAKTYAEMVQDSFLRRPEWRYRRALCLLETGKTRGSKKTDDEWTLANLRLMHHLAKGRQLRRLPPQWKALHTAHLLYRLEQHSLVRLELECRILAGQSSELVAKTTSLPPAVVEAFGKTFFDIRDRLDCELYIQCVVIGDTCTEQLMRERDRIDLLLKQQAYRLQGQSLELLILAYRLTVAENARDTSDRTLAVLRELMSSRTEFLKLLVTLRPQPIFSQVNDLLSALGIDVAEFLRAGKKTSSHSPAEKLASAV